MACSGEKGKLSFRIYPPWSKPVAKEAIRTQEWQLKYFLPINEDGTADIKLVEKFILHNANHVVLKKILTPEVCQL